MTSRILIADPSKLARTKLRHALAKEGYHVVESATGTHAFEVWNSQGVDLLIAEVNLPLLDGYDLAKSIRRSSEKNSRIPILFLTSQSDGDAISKGREAGITGWIVKPFEPMALMQAIAQVLPVTKPRSRS
jgi:two-component system, chemotaxis family, chemotaxis protein CheY